MTDSEKFDLILSKLDALENKMQALENKMQDRFDALENRVQALESRMQDLESEMQELKRRITSIELHLENATDKNIQLIAENFIELTKKLNQAIPAADKNLAYEVKVNYLIREVDILKEEVAKLKNKTA